MQHYYLYDRKIIMVFYIFATGVGNNNKFTKTKLYLWLG